MKTSRLFAVSAAALMAMSLTACPNNGNKKIEIVIWTTYNDTYQQIINNVIDQFKEIEPNVVVKNIKQQGSYQDLAKMCVDGFAVDNYPDMVAAYPDSVSDFITNGKALNSQA